MEPDGIGMDLGKMIFHRLFFPDFVSDFLCFLFFQVFSPTVFVLASAGSALQALGAAERAGEEAPKPA